MDEARRYGGLTDDQWRPLCLRVQAGARAKDVATEARVRPAALYRAQRRLKLRVKDLAPEVRLARRRAAPDFADRPDDYRYNGFGLSEGQWREIAPLFREGWSSEALGDRFGCCDSVIRRGMRLRGVKRAPKPRRRLKARPRGLDAPPPLSRDPDVRAACAFAVVPEDVAATLAGLDAAKGRAAEAGLIEAVEFTARAGLAVAREATARLKLEAETARITGRAVQSQAGAGSAGGAPSTATRSPSPSEGDGEETQAPVLHPHQRPPEGDWATWLVLGGRGAGKTLAGASWVAEQAARLGAGGRIALVGATIHDVREVMIGGPSGLMNLGRWGEARPVYSPTRRRVQFPGGCEGWVFSAEEPDRLRGPQFHCAWADEYCAWKPGAGVQDALAMLRLGLRLGARPQLVITTTPRPTRALKRLMAEPGVAVTRAGTGANAAHLAPGFVAGLTALYGGTRLAAQEIDGQVVDDGLALFSAEMMSSCRGEAPGEGLERVVVGVDPCVTAGGHACGIVVVGRAGARAFVLADRTVKGVSPEAWARAAVAAARDHGAAGLVVEVNQGGELVSGLLRAIGAGITVKPVRASVGKRARAEPVAALYEQGRVIHAGAGLEALEEELMGIGEEAGDLDRADALVWAVTDLMLGEPGAMPRVRGFDWRA